MELQDEHDKFSGILASLDTGLILINRNFTVDWVNEQARLMFPEGNPVDAFCYEFYAGRAKTCEGCPSLKVFETGEACQLERYRKKTGRWYSILAQPVLDASGNVVKVLEGITDITTRKHIEEALVKSESKWRHILMNAPQVGISLDPSGKITFANDHFLKLTGWKRDEVLGRNWFQTFVPGNIRDQVQGIFKAVMSQSHAHGYSNYENDILHRNGECLTVAWSNVLTLDPLGYPMDVTCMGVDVTERRRSEKALKESEERFKALHNASFGGIAIHDKGVILDCNQGLSEISGYTQEELAGMDGLLLIAERSRSEVMGNILSGYEKPYEAFGVRKSGEEYPLRLEARNIPYQGRMVRAVEFRDITARKRAEANLLSSELRLRTLRDSIPDLVWLKNTDGVYLSCNPAFERFLGCKEEQIVGKSDYDFFVPALAEFFRDNDRKAIEVAGTRMNEEWLTFAQDGYHGLFETLKTPMRDEAGMVIGVLGIARDITERRRQAEELESFFSVILDLLCIADMEGNFLKTNEAWSRTLGYSTADLNGKKLLEFVHPDDMQATLDVMSSLGKGEDVLDFTNRYRCKDGTYRYIEWRSHPKGNLIYAAARDVTERKWMEKTLRESEERLRLANKATNDVIWDWDVIHDLQRWSESGTTVFGWTDIVEHPMTAHWWVARVHPDDRQRIHDSFFAAVNDPRRDVWHDEYRFLKADGTYADVLDRGHVLRDAEGKAIRMIGAMLDITERKRIEEALRESEEKHRLLFESMAQGVIYQAADGAILSANPAAERILGLSLEQMRGKTSMDPRWKMINGDGSSVAGYEHPAMIALRTGETVDPVIRGVFHPETNTYTWLSIVAIPQFHPGEEKAFQV
jgi:PAS domain S-box-containing protein